jgi:uncharacterized protein (DUF2147 family)
MKWRNLPRLWLFQMLDAVRRPLKYFRVLHVPIQTNLHSGHAGLSCAVLAAWLIASGTALAQTVQGPTTQPAQSPAADPIGEWMVAQQIARIKIADCDGRLWGVVAWEAKPGTDSKNPDPNLRSRPTLGMPILLGMTPSKSSNWNGQQTKTNKWEGQIYNSEDGHTYSASISLVDPHTLRVQGCFLGFLCGGENWTRVEPQDAQPAAPAERNTAKPSGTRKTAVNQQPPAPPSDDVCSKALGSSTTGLSHERRLK